MYQHVFTDCIPVTVFTISVLSQSVPKPYKTHPLRVSAPQKTFFITVQQSHPKIVSQHGLKPRTYQTQLYITSQLKVFACFMTQLNSTVTHRCQIVITFYIAQPIFLILIPDTAL